MMRLQLGVIGVSRYYVRKEVGCGCGGNNASPQTGESLPAMAFIPVQQFGAVYEAEAGFPRGTIFPELDKPFTAAGGMNCGL
ncbi:MAG: spore coat associated protein CotJA [Clostridia bacterium]|nr:spore coat associated protein CotJA [Clostridia bacterium]